MESFSHDNQIIFHFWKKGEFREENFNTAMSVLKDAGDAGKGDSAFKGRKGGTQGILYIHIRGRKSDKFIR